jgi:hypothetical protein
MPGGPAAASLFLVPSRSRWVADEVQLAHRTLDLQKMTQARTETGVDPKFLDRQYLDTEKVRRTEGHTRNRHQDSGRDCREAGMMDAGVELRLSRAGVPWGYTKIFRSCMDNEYFQFFTDLKVLSIVEAEFAVLLRIVLLTALKPSEIFGNEKAIGHGM